MNAEANTDRLVADLKRVVRDSENILAESAGVVGDKCQDMRERLAETLQSAKAACRRLEERTIEGAKATDKAIRTHPYQSMGVALGVGLLVGFLITRKHAE